MMAASRASISSFVPPTEDDDGDLPSADDSVPMGRFNPTDVVSVFGRVRRRVAEQ